MYPLRAMSNECPREQTILFSSRVNARWQSRTGHRSMIDCKMALVVSIKRTVALVSLCILAISASAGARRKKPQSEAVFSYYLLSLSYAPDFCAQPTGNKDVRECGTGRRVGFVVH